MMFPWIKKHFTLILILALGLCLRTFRLDKVPPAMNHDELDYLLNGYSFIKTGHDLYGQSFSLTLGGLGYSSLPGYITGIFLSFLPFTQSSARLVASIFGVISIWSIYQITQSLFNKHKLSLLVSLMFSLSFWAISISRMIYDPPTASFFFLLALALCLSAKHFFQFCIGIILLTLGAFSYYGSQPLYLPIISVLSFYRRDLFINRSRILLVIGVSVVSLLAMWFSLNSINKNTLTFSRTRDLSFTNFPKIEAQVIAERSDYPSILNKPFINKLTVSFRNFSADYLSAFDPEMIFVTGDPNRQLGLWNRGELVYLDFIFILIGIFWAIRKYPRQTIFIFLMLVISPLSTGLSGRVYVTRSFLQWPFLILLSGLGLYHLMVNINRKLIILPLVVFYIFMITNSLHQYFFRYPIYANEIWFGSERKLATYLGKSDSPLTIYAPEARQMFMEYLFYNGFNPLEVQPVLDKNNPQADIHFRNLTFINNCPNLERFPGPNIITHHICYPDKKYFRPLIIAEDKSDRVIWYISTSEN